MSVTRYCRASGSRHATQRLHKVDQYGSFVERGLHRRTLCCFFIVSLWLNLILIPTVFLLAPKQTWLQKKGVKSMHLLGESHNLVPECQCHSHSYHSSVAWGRRRLIWVVPLQLVEFQSDERFAHPDSFEDAHVLEDVLKNWSDDLPRM